MRLAALACCLLSTAAYADDQITLLTSYNAQRNIVLSDWPVVNLRPVPNQGWWSDSLSNVENSANYLTGQFVTADGQVENLRSFFAFDLTPVLGTEIVGATLELQRGQYLSSAPSETVGLFDVSNPIGALMGLGPSDAIYGDLGSGVSYGAGTVGPGFSNDLLTFPLDVAGLSAINGLLNSNNPHPAAGLFFSIGASVLSLDGSTVPSGGGTAESVFGGTSSLTVAQLVLTVANAPEPATFLLAIMGAILLLVRRR